MDVFISLTFADEYRIADNSCCLHGCCK